METRDYSKFNLIDSNRPISKLHIEKLKKSITEFGYFKSKPITVTPKYKIIDGQHRFMACKELKIPVQYEVDNMPMDKAMVQLNTTSVVWRQDEFIHHYSKLKIDGYSELLEFMESTKYGVTNCLAIFTGNQFKAKNVKDGEPLVKGNKIEEIVDFIEFLRGKVAFFQTGIFIRAIIYFFNDPTTDRKHIERLKSNVYGIIQCATNTQYTAQFNKLSKKK